MVCWLNTAIAGQPAGDRIPATKAKAASCIGDLREFVQRSGLRSATLGHGFHLTWYYATPTKAFSSTHWLFQLIKIPIDHIFVSQNMHVDRVTAAPPGVSDHRPLIAKIRV